MLQTWLGWLFNQSENLDFTHGPIQSPNVRWWLGASFITETKRKVFRFHETILRRWARIPRVERWFDFVSPHPPPPLTTIVTKETSRWPRVFPRHDVPVEASRWIPLFTTPWLARWRKVGERDLVPKKRGGGWQWWIVIRKIGLLKVTSLRSHKSWCEITWCETPKR